MAYLSKDEYYRREQAAKRRMAKNAEIDTLTQEQHEALAEICRLRHKFHWQMGKCLFLSEGPDSKEAWELVDTDVYENTIQTLISDSSLPEWDWSCSAIDYPNDLDFNEYKLVDTDGTVYPEDIDPDEKEDIYNKKYSCAREMIANLASDWNSSIEDYLKRIDKEYGTNYCPTGALRFLNVPWMQ